MSLSVTRARLAPRILSRRAAYFTTSNRRSSTPWSSSPAPPRLPKEEQEIFEELQRQSTGAFSTPRSDSDAKTSSDLRAQINQSPQAQSSQTAARSIGEPETTTLDARVNAEGKGDELHPNIRRGAPPEFEGDTNPKTGEVGGPKVEPLRWGSGGDYSYNGRVTDF